MNNTPSNNNPSPDEDDLTGMAEMAHAAPAPLNPEDLTSFSISTDFHDNIAKKVLTTVPVRKPTRGSFIRTHPDAGCWQKFGVLELKETAQMYLLAPQVAAALREEGETTLTTAILVLCVDRRGNPFLWPLKVSERYCDWNSSALQAAEHAKSKWVRVDSNISAGCYDTVVSRLTAQPAWPSESYKDILSLAFKGRVIKSYDDPIIQELRGL
jgi:hypothetical protein